MYISEDNSETERVLSETLTALLNRPVDQLRERLLVGSPEVCAEKLAAYKAAGVQRVCIWPIKDEIEQLTIFQQKVAPQVDRGGTRVSKENRADRHLTMITLEDGTPQDASISKTS